MRDQPKAKGSPGNQYTGPVPKKDQSTPTLTDIGIDKKLSARAQKLAAVPEEKFEGMIGECCFLAKVCRCAATAEGKRGIPLTRPGPGNRLNQTSRGHFLGEMKKTGICGRIVYIYITGLITPKKRTPAPTSAVFFCPFVVRREFPGRRSMATPSMSGTGEYNTRKGNNPAVFLR